MGFDIAGTRPTMDRVKESLFAMIQNRIKDATVLDLFAGSGSLGIEALSNGAQEVYFVEYGSQIYEILKKNVSGIEGVKLYPMDYQAALKKMRGITFDIVFLDPPYLENLITPVLPQLEFFLKKDSLVVCEFENEKIEVPSSYQLWKEKKYGEKHISIYRYLG